MTTRESRALARNWARINEQEDCHLSKRYRIRSFSGYTLVGRKRCFHCKFFSPGGSLIESGVLIGLDAHDEEGAG